MLRRFGARNIMQSIVTMSINTFLTKEKVAATKSLVKTPEIPRNLVVKGTGFSAYKQKGASFPPHSHLKLADSSAQSNSLSNLKIVLSKMASGNMKSK